MIKCYFNLYRNNSKEHIFLQDFINCSGNTAGARLARWLQPDPHVDISNCQLVLPEGEFYCGHEVSIVIHLKDQDKQVLHALDVNAKIIVMLFNGTNQATEYDSDTKKFDRSVVQHKGNSEQAEKQQSPSTHKEILIVKQSLGKLTAIWVPQIAGTYSIHCIIDGQIKEVSS